MTIKADLHIHSCLSPCGDLMMSPLSIVNTALKKGLNLIAISDHNTAKNCIALKNICDKRNDIHCLFGIEITTMEEVHALSLFDDIQNALDMSDFLYNYLPDIKNIPEKYGDQIIVDEEDNIIGEIDKFLITGVELGFEEIEREVHKRNGLFIPAHVDRDTFSLTSQLGYCPIGNYDAVEFSKYYFRNKLNKIEDQNKEAMLKNAFNYPIISNSDAHYLENIGVIYTEYELDDISLSSLKKCLSEKKFKVKFYGLD